MISGWYFLRWQITLSQVVRLRQIHMGKKFKILGNEIKDLAQGYGGCFASDMITVQGHKVGFMYREDPEDARLSGWVFLSGEETQEYIDDPDYFEIYNVNTIANYDPDIIQLLDAPYGSEFERDENGKLSKI